MDRSTSIGNVRGWARGCAWAIAAAVNLCAQTACDTGGDAALRDVSLVGQVSDAIYVALVADEGELLVYACDGTEEQVGVSAWFTGAHDAGVFDLTNPAGARVSGEFDGDVAQGTLTLPGGEEIAFEAVSEGGDSGLYAFEEVLEDEELRGGWIVREEGTRGAVINRTTGDLVTGTQLTVSALQVTVLGQQFNLIRLLYPAIG